MVRQSGNKWEICYVDMGGTFTDFFAVDKAGNWVSSKVESTPQDISSAFFSGIEATCKKAELPLKDLLNQLSVVGYGGTVALNTLLTRTGRKTGLIVDSGFEHLVIMDRGKQAWLDLPFRDRVHVVVHRHTNPLVPLSLTRTVTERVDCLGEVQIPLYEHDVRQAAEDLLGQDVEAFAICFLFSWQNSVHEHRAKEIIEQVAEEKGKKVDVYCSADVMPALREFPRMNTTMIEAYVARAGRVAWGKIDDWMKELTFKGNLQILQSSGGLATAAQVKVVETLVSGPVGGLIGAQYIGKLYGFDNIITTDVGGTSFDVGLVTDGQIAINRQPEVAGLMLALPVAEVNSIGAGGGSIISLDPLTKRIEVGPASAGANPGAICYDIGGEEPTVTDADLILGYLNPDYFLGGKLKLNKEKTVRIFKKKIADPLGLSVEEAALGVNKLLDTKMKDTILGLVMSRGYEISDYYLMAFGGSGPSHVAGYSDGLPVKGVLVFPFSAVFCAFGSATADYKHYYTRSANIVVPPLADAHTKLRLGQDINKLWEMLEEEAYRQMKLEGFSLDQVSLEYKAMIRYGRQLDDLIISSPITRVSDVADWDKLINAFETMYEKVYVSAAKFPQAGYEIFEVGLTAAIPKIRPKLKRYTLAGAPPPPSTLKGTRACWFAKGATDTQIYYWEGLEAGNQIVGPAILESATTNLIVPPGKSARIDEYHTVWLENINLGGQ